MAEGLFSTGSQGAAVVITGAATAGQLAREGAEFALAAQDAAAFDAVAARGRQMGPRVVAVLASVRNAQQGHWHHRCPQDCHFILLREFT